MLKIFLAHAKEDKKIVTDLYHRLKEKGYKPWLDKEDLLPGQIWRAEIPKAIKNSQVFIACLSNRSVEKQGYVQDEFKMALKTCASKPPGSIYLIPIRLDECVIPELRQEEYGMNLRDIHWLDFFEADGFDRLVRALEYAKEVRPIKNSVDIPIDDSTGPSPPPIPPLPKREERIVEKSEEDSVDIPTDDSPDLSPSPIPPLPKKEGRIVEKSEEDSSPVEDEPNIGNPVGVDLRSLFSRVDRKLIALTSFSLLMGLAAGLWLTSQKDIDSPPKSDLENNSAVQDKLFSSGARFLTLESICRDATGECADDLRAMSSSFENAVNSNNYSEVIEVFRAATKDYPNKPELHIYLNNALVRQAVANGFSGRKITLAATVPIGSPAGSDTEGRANEILRGIADAQSCYIGSQEDEQFKSPFICPPNLDELLLEVVIVDDENNSDTAVKNAKAIVENEAISGVIGHYASGVTDAALNTYNTSGVLDEYRPIPVISPASTKYDLRKSDNFYRTTASTKKQGNKIAEYLQEQDVEAVLGVYDDEDEYSEALWDGFDDAFPNIKIVGETVARPSDTVDIISELEENFRKQLEDLIGDGQKFAVVIAPPSTFNNGTITSEEQKWNLVKRISEAVREKDTSGQYGLLIGGNDLYAQEALKTANGLYGMAFTVSWFSDYYKSNLRDDEDDYESYAMSSEEKWRGRISWVTANSYDATHVFMQAFANITSESTAIRGELIERIQDVVIERAYSSGEEIKFEEKEPIREPFLLRISEEVTDDDPNEYKIEVVDAPQ